MLHFDEALLQGRSPLIAAQSRQPETGGSEGHDVLQQTGFWTVHSEMDYSLIAFLNQRPA